MPSGSRVDVPRWMLLVGAVALEVALALIMRELRILGLVQLVAIAAVGLYSVLQRNLGMVLCVIAYVTGSEVLWRQVRAPVFYLAAPYVVILLSGFAVLFQLRRLGKDARLAVLYAALLLPSVVATIRTAGEGSRELISFALSGPLALAAFVAFTSQVKIAPALYRRVMWITLISSVGPLTIAVSTLRADLAAQGSVEFRGQSNFAASGGFGPVQVSSALSLGIMAAIFLIISERDRIARTIASVLAVVLAVQTLLTFSRGGSFSVAIAVTILFVMQARNKRIRNRIVAIAAVSLVLAYFFVFPWLESFTGGEFDKRFSDTESARTELAANDTEIFARNILFGVGPGMTKYQRLTYEICELRSDKCAAEASSHTEFTRMLGEHGIPGLAALVLLSMLAWRIAYRRSGPAAVRRRLDRLGDRPDVLRQPAHRRRAVRVRTCVPAVLRGSDETDPPPDPLAAAGRHSTAKVDDVRRSVATRSFAERMTPVPATHWSPARCSRRSPPCTTVTHPTRR